MRQLMLNYIVADHLLELSRKHFKPRHELNYVLCYYAWVGRPF